jgi:phosphohistidine phosphatase
VQRQSRRIVVMRHAKAEQVGPTDMERELAQRGRDDSSAAGRWLAGQAISPDHVLVSAATRTRQTWQSVAGAAGWDAEATFDRGLYAAGPETALDLMRSAPDDATTLVLVGHNPTVAYLAQMLDDGDGDDDAAQQMTMGYPTSALAVFEYDGAWADLDQGCARLVAFHVGRG